MDKLIIDNDFKIDTFDDKDSFLLIFDILTQNMATLSKSPDIKRLNKTFFGQDIEKLHKMYGITRFLINSFYAIKGKKFKTAKWKGIFNNFDWYKPDNKPINFSDDEQELINTIRILDTALKQEIDQFEKNQD